MDERILQLRVGIVVISAVVITAILIMIFGEWQPATYRVNMKFPTVPGVSENTPIRKNGITIGRVTKVQPTEEGVLLEAAINKDYEIFQSEGARVGAASMINDDAIIDIVPGRGEFVSATVPDGSWITETSVKRGMDDLIEEAFELRAVLERRLDQTATSIDQASRSITQTSNQIGDVALSLNTILTDENGELKSLFRNAEAVAAEAEIALRNFGSVMEDIDQIMGDENLRKRLQESMDQVPRILAETEALLKEANQAVQQFKHVGITVEKNLQNLEGITEPLGENGEQILANLQVTVQNVDKMVNEITRFLDSVNNSKGTVGLLLNDPRLHDEVLRSLRNVEEITRSIKPILADVKTTTHKIATDPRQLGIKGALDRRPVGSGPKGTFLYKDYVE
jgi:phospholipid/cholesterol/gamma-HCH transport system substrate-binding protein